MHFAHDSYIVDKKEKTRQICGVITDFLLFYHVTASAKEHQVILYRCVRFMVTANDAQGDAQSVTQALTGPA